MQESIHVYIKNGLAKIPTKPLHILEFGFGTGLNALLTALYSEENQQNISYTTVEKYPVLFEELKTLNYAKLTNDAEDFLGKMHRSPWEQWVPVSANMKIYKQQEDFRNFSSNHIFDLVYFDVFGYRVQPHLWHYSVFENVYNHMSDNALLTTYCSKGEVRRSLEKVGFLVEKLEGPPGKREMINAWKKETKTNR